MFYLHIEDLLQSIPLMPLFLTHSLDLLISIGFSCDINISTYIYSDVTTVTTALLFPTFGVRSLSLSLSAHRSFCTLCFFPTDVGTLFFIFVYLTLCPDFSNKIRKMYAKSKILFDVKLQIVSLPKNQNQLCRIMCRIKNNNKQCKFVLYTNRISHIRFTSLFFFCPVFYL